MNQTSERIQKMQESATLAMARKSRELTESGIDVVNLSLGEPDFDTPEFIKEAAYKAIKNNITHYTPVNGFLELRKAISNKFKRDNGIDYNVDQIVVSTGAKQSLNNIILSLINPGDEVILPTPYWVSYEAIVEMADGSVKQIPTSIENEFKISEEVLEANISKNTKLMMFSTPCNPSGSVYTKEELRGIANVMERHPHFYVVSDEIYEHINFTGKHESLAQFDSIKDRVITVNGLSKGFAMTGWRLGYIGAPEWIAKACTKLQGQVTSGTNSITQMAAIAALNAEPSVTIEMKNTFKKRKELITGLLKDIPGLIVNNPEGAFYVFPDVTSFFGKSHGSTMINNASDLSLFLLTEGHVAVVTGDAFGSPNNIRIAYAASDDTIIEAVNRIKETLAKLN